MRRQRRPGQAMTVCETFHRAVSEMSCRAMSLTRHQANPRRAPSWPLSVPETATGITLLMRRRSQVTTVSETSHRVDEPTTRHRLLSCGRIHRCLNQYHRGPLKLVRTQHHRPTSPAHPVSNQHTSHTDHHSQSQAVSLTSQRADATRL